MGNQRETFSGSIYVKGIESGRLSLYGYLMHEDVHLIEKK